MRADKQFAYSLMQRVALTEAAGIKATIQSIVFNAEGVQYQVAYWLDGTRRVEWVFAHEIAALQEPASIVS